MRVRMLLKSGFGAIRHAKSSTPRPTTPASASRSASSLPSMPRPPPSPTGSAAARPRCGTVSRPRQPPQILRRLLPRSRPQRQPYLARHYDSHFVPADTDHLYPQQEAALAEPGGPADGYTVPAEYAAGMLTVAAENAVDPPQRHRRPAAIRHLASPLYRHDATPGRRRQPLFRRRPDEVDRRVSGADGDRAAVQAGRIEGVGAIRRGRDEPPPAGRRRPGEPAA